MEKKSSRFETLLGISVIAGLITGLAGFLAAVFAFSNADWVGTGLCLLAAAFSFGLLAKALLRN